MDIFSQLTIKVFQIALNFDNSSKLSKVNYIVKKIDFIIEKQIVRHFVQYSECLSTTPSLLCNSND